MHQRNSRKNIATHRPPQSKNVQRLGNCPLLDWDRRDSLKLNPTSYNDFVAIVQQVTPEARGRCGRLVGLVGLDGLDWEVNVGFGIVVGNQRRHPLLWGVAVSLDHHALLFVVVMVIMVFGNWRWLLTQMSAGVVESLVLLSGNLDGARMCLIRLLRFRDNKIAKAVM